MLPFESCSTAILADVRLSICVPALGIGASSAFSFTFYNRFRGHALG